MCLDSWLNFALRFQSPLDSAHTHTTIKIKQKQNAYLDFLEAEHVLMPGEHRDGLVVQLHGLLVVAVRDHHFEPLGQLVQEAQSVQQTAHTHQFVHLFMKRGWFKRKIINC